MWFCVELQRKKDRNPNTEMQTCAQFLLTFGRTKHNVSLKPQFASRSKHCPRLYRGADKSLARPGRKQATATEDFDVHISYL